MLSSLILCLVSEYPKITANFMPLEGIQGDPSNPIVMKLPNLVDAIFGILALLGLFYVDLKDPVLLSSVPFQLKKAFDSALLNSQQTVQITGEWTLKKYSRK